MPDLVPLPHSQRAAIPGATPAALDQQETITVTLVLRRRAAMPAELVTGPQTITADELAAQYGAAPEDVELARATLASLGLTVTAVHAGSRRLMVSGTVAAMSAAFGTTLTAVTSDHLGTGETTHRYREGGLSVPAALSGVVLAVLGLDNRPVARPQVRLSPRASSSAAAGHPVPLTAVQVGDLYNFPPGTDGTGQTIAIIELGGGYTAADLQQYFSGLGLPVPSVSSVPVDGGSNSPGTDTNADGEVALDIEVAGAVAPGAAQVVYFGNNTDQAFIGAVADAAHATPTPAVISISWGGPEPQWSQQSLAAMDSAFQDAAALGVTVTVAAGDNGSSDDPQNPGGPAQVDFPASSPHALACGGTTLVGNLAAGKITSEVVWNEVANSEGAGGGGISKAYAVPAWQSPAASASLLTGRGVPDVCGNADPVSGYQVIVGGQQQPIGGTSAVAPLWAGLIARLAQATGRKFGLLQPLLYAGASAGTGVAGFNDITVGNNGAYSAAPGWDPCTGLGSPHGAALLARLSAPASGSGA
jgi:kumamolisin